MEEITNKCMVEREFQKNDSTQRNLVYPKASQRARVNVQMTEVDQLWVSTSDAQY